MQTTFQNETRILYNEFSTSEGITELYITATSRDDATFIEALEEIKDAYRSVLSDLGLDGQTLQFTRVYVSDAANEYQVLLQSELYEILSNGAISVIEQSPLCGPLSVLCYHLKSETGTLQKTISRNPETSVQNLYLKGRHYNLFWNAHGISNGKDSFEQTNTVFSDLSKNLEKYKMDVRHNTVRTWIYVRDIDNNYKGMVVARRELFSKIGLTNKTRYIASTGIEGSSAETDALVAMDSLSIGNLKEEQIVRMEAPENLSSTIIYGVTFERGLKILFGDRAHLYISGTASIDCNGEIMFPGDIRGQAERTLDNIEALLKPHGAQLENMQYLIIYLRNKKQFQFIQDILSLRLPASIPVIAVEGSVCRPGWLIEIEGVAIVEETTAYPPFI